MKSFQCRCTHCGSSQSMNQRPVTWFCTICSHENKFNPHSTTLQISVSSEELQVYIVTELNKQGVGFELEYGTIIVNSIRKEITLDLILHKAKHHLHQPDIRLPDNFKKIKKGRMTICYICPVSLTTYVTQERVMDVLYLRFIKRLPFTPQMKIFNQSREMELFVRRKRLSEKI